MVRRHRRGDVIHRADEEGEDGRGLGAVDEAVPGVGVPQFDHSASLDTEGDRAIPEARGYGGDAVDDAEVPRFL